MSEVKVDSIGPRVDSGTLTIGAAGDTVNIAGTAGTGFPTPTTGIAASAISSGTIATARLGSGTASSSTFLRGDQTYAAAGEVNTPCFLAYKTGTTTFASGAFTLLINTSIVQNDNSTYDSSNGRFTCPSGGDGTYYMYGSFRINNYDPERIQGAFYVNGSQLAHSLQETVPDGSVSGRHPSMMISMIMNLSATDYVEFRGMQQSGSTDTVFSSVFGGFKIK